MPNFKLTRYQKAPWLASHPSDPPELAGGSMLRSAALLERRAQLLLHFEDDGGKRFVLAIRDMRQPARLRSAIGMRRELCENQRLHRLDDRGVDIQLVCVTGHRPLFS